MSKVVKEFKFSGNIEFRLKETCTKSEYINGEMSYKSVIKI
jgi:hypothetical protein